MRTNAPDKPHDPSTAVKASLSGQSFPRWLIWSGGIALVVGTMIAAGIGLTPIDHLATGSYTRTITIDCEYGKFRKIMVRKNATAAIVAHGGMEIIDQQTHDIQLDTSGDDRPILNAILGRSKSDLSAVRQLTVSLDDPMLEADRLVLRQQSDITESGMKAVSKSKTPAGRLKRYETSMNANPSSPVDGGSGRDESNDGGSAEQTTVQLFTELDVLVSVPRWFRYKADQGVQQAAIDAVDGQADALQMFIAEHVDKRIIFPQLGK